MAIEVVEESTELGQRTHAIIHYLLRHKTFLEETPKGSIIIDFAGGHVAFKRTAVDEAT